MPSITNLLQFKSYVPVNFTSTQTATMPNMEVADEDILWPVLGEAFYNTILASSDAKYDRLKELARRAVAPLALMKSLAIKQVKVSDMGLHSVQTADAMPAPRWAFKELENSLANDGTKALEKLWEYLYVQDNTFGWTNPHPYRTMFAGGKVFSYYYYLHQPNRLFASLLPLIAEVEEHYLFVAIGKDFAIGLRDKVSPTALELQAFNLIRHAVANLTIFVACKKLAINIGPNGFNILFGDGGDTYDKGKSDSSNTEKQALAVQCENDGLRWLGQLKALLNTNASTTVFATYFTSSLYKSPTTPAVTDPNNLRSAVIAL